tara:strand:- start:2469 stop:3002 length:534 start_codon:yes stop_codon:yes gene_type:complete
MTPQEQEKISLMQLMKQGKIGTLPDVDTAYMSKKLIDKEKTNEVGGMLNITDPSNPKPTTMEAMITTALAKAYPSAEQKDIQDYYNMLMSDVKSGAVSLDGLDVADDFEEFAQENNIPLTDPQGGQMAEETPKSNDEMSDDERENFYTDLEDVNEETVNEETIDEGVKWMKRFSGIK